MVKVIVADKVHDAEHCLGQFMDESHYDVLIEEDCDFYAPADCSLEEKVGCDQDCSGCAKGADESRLIFKFRKNAFTHKEYSDAYKGLIGAAQPMTNRGLAAGPRGEKTGDRFFVNDMEYAILNYFIKKKGNNLFDEETDAQAIARIRREHPADKPSSDVRGYVWRRGAIEEDGLEYGKWFDTWVESLFDLPKEEQAAKAMYVNDKYISDTNYAKAVMSGVAGYYDRFVRFPYGRVTAYSEEHPEWELCLPYVQKLNQYFKELVPGRWAAQKAAADKIDPRFLVKDTVFTTITVNKNFRTAAHRDAGDLSVGFSNLAALTGPDNIGWEGAYLAFPQFRVAVNCRPGDLLLVNNHEGIHGNTDITSPIEESDRCTLVCYFRENMLELGSWEYEQTRKNFVEFCRQNKEHEYWRAGFNGVYPGMWTSQEWYDYCKEHGGIEMLNQYHPEATAVKASLEDFF